MNQSQRIAIFITLVLVVGVLFIHFPFGGYVNEHIVVVERGSGPCPRLPTLEELKSISAADLNKNFELLSKCTDKEETQTLPISEWVSVNPIFPWFGSLLNTAMRAGSG